MSSKKDLASVTTDLSALAAMMPTQVGAPDVRFPLGRTSPSPSSEGHGGSTRGAKGALFEIRPLKPSLTFIGHQFPQHSSHLLGRSVWPPVVLCTVSRLRVGPVSRPAAERDTGGGRGFRDDERGKTWAP